jgi:hypothetical protein
MTDLSSEMALAEQQIGLANAALEKAIRERKAVKGGDSATVGVHEAKVVAARAALTAAEVKLRRLYEERGGD